MDFMITAKTPTRWAHRVLPIATATLVLCAAAASVAAAQWNPAGFAKESTVELLTNCPGEGDHWFPVWLVVLDNQVYVRLGSRATGRVQCNKTAPFLGVKIAGQQFDHVHGVPAPEYAERVSNAMADKYWTDLFVRYMNHPLTLRLMPE
jgi:hypothetical protein